MNKVYKVFSRETGQVDRSVEIGGKPVRALVSGTLVQLVPIEDDGGGTLKIAIDDDSLGLFEPGALIEVSFAAFSATE